MCPRINCCLTIRNVSHVTGVGRRNRTVQTMSPFKWPAVASVCRQGYAARLYAARLRTYRNDSDRRNTLFDLCSGSPP
jgi:hypothetical protein